MALRRLDPRAAVIAALVLLVGVALSDTPAVLAWMLPPVLLGLIAARLSVRAFFLRLAAVLPIVAMFAVMTALAGDSQRALLLFARGATSAVIVLLLGAAVPLQRLLEALLWMKAPAPLVDSIHFVYRYLTVLGEQLWRMRTAASARGGASSSFAAMSHVRVLFAAAYGRAEHVHRSMLARGWQGGPLTPPLRGFLPAAGLALVLCSLGYVTLVLAATR